MTPRQLPLSVADMHDMIVAYISRHDLEYNDYKAQRREGRPKHPKQVLLENVKEHDWKEVCDHVRKWDRDFNSIASIKVKRVKEGHLEAALADKPAVPAEDKEME
ncbi:hypothetical protein HDU91_002048 [Kappamyces sp. JEL0680]|nr:hypothetical protein HDU91_002048 [Kappamyces sp. JEL0680]